MRGEERTVLAIIFQEGNINTPPSETDLSSVHTVPFSFTGAAFCVLFFFLSFFSQQGRQLKGNNKKDIDKRCSKKTKRHKKLPLMYKKEVV